MCYYNTNASGEAEIYGALYTWAAAMGDNAISSDTNEVQGVCPNGWHLPSADEFTELIDSTISEVGNIKLYANSTWCSGFLDIYSDELDSYGESGFLALSGGWRSDLGDFNDECYLGVWWSSAGYNSVNSYFFQLYYDGYPYDSSTLKSEGHSVRCVKD